MESKKKETSKDEEKENASPVCYANSDELREEFLEPDQKKPTTDPKKPKGNSKNCSGTEFPSR